MNKFTRKLLKPLDWLFNHNLKNYIIGGHSVYIVGEKGAGKSTLFALAAEVSKKSGSPVFSQYPYEGAYKIPVIKEDRGKYVYINHTKLSNGKWFDEKKWVPEFVYSIDKQWFFKSKFEDCTILLDEARTIWPNRKYQDWTISDDEFFNFLRKNNVALFFSSQNHDAIDLNCRRSTDENWFLWKKSPSSPFTHIEVYRTMEVPIADLNREVVLSSLSKPMHPMNWDICSTLVKKFIFYRPPYYGLFDTNFYYGDQEPVKADLWE